MKKSSLHKRIILFLLQFNAFKNFALFLIKLHPKLRSTIYDHYDQLKQHDAPACIPLNSQKEEISAYEKLLCSATQLTPHTQIFVDLSTIAMRDMNTGIQRVTRSVLKELFLICPKGYMIQPVYRHDDVFYYARKFTLNFLGVNHFTIQDEPIIYHKKDIFLGLDLSIALPQKLHTCLSNMSAAGVKIYHVIYDVLYMTHSDLFVSPMSRFENWLTCVSRWSNGLLFISNDSLNEYSRIRDQLKFKTYPDIKLATFPMGTDLTHSKMEQTSTAHLSTLEKFTAQGITFLMVGTLEPRKAHALVLKAFTLLWKKGITAKLLFVGRKGWAPEIYHDFTDHPEYNKNFLWLEHADDEDIKYAYNHASALIMASLAEGYGLPIIEALHYHLPVIARDIPIFREVGGDNLNYFDTNDPKTLAAYLQTWLATPAHLDKKPPLGITLHTWQDSAQQIIDYIVHEKWEVC